MEAQLTGKELTVGQILNSRTIKEFNKIETGKFISLLVEGERGRKIPFKGKVIAKTNHFFTVQKENGIRESFGLYDLIEKSVIIC